MKEEIVHILSKNAHLGSEDGGVFEPEVVAMDNYGGIGLVETLSCRGQGILHIVVELGIGILAHTLDPESRDGNAIAVYLYGRHLYTGMKHRPALPHNSQRLVHIEVAMVSRAYYYYVSRPG